MEEFTLARYTNRIPMQNVDFNYVTSQIANYMAQEGFSIIDYKGQRVWKKGSGLATAPQYLSITCTPQEVIVEAFIRFALLPGVYVGEMGITGFFGAVPKSLLSSRVRSVEEYLYSIITQQHNQMQAQQAAANSVINP